MIKLFRVTIREGSSGPVYNPELMRRIVNSEPKIKPPSKKVEPPK